MISRKFSPTAAVKLLLILCLMLGASSGAAVSAQDKPNSFAAERERAIQMINEGKYVESLPLFEKLAAAKEADGDVFFGLGIALLHKADQSKDVSSRKEGRVKARNALLKAKEFGLRNPQLDSLLSQIKPDGGERGKSDDPKANEAMNEAFAAFAGKNYLKAAELYEKAARLDPTLYEAALYTGNSFYGARDHEKAGVWFARAIALDQNRETAHRYWGDSLMVSGKTEEAKNKFFDAIVAEPYNQTAWRGLIQFAQINNLKVTHPKIDIPTGISSNEKGDRTTITLDESILKDSKDGSAAWMMYGISRAAWRTSEFSKRFPNEKTYRHSLAEESAALRSVLEAVKNQSKDIKQLNPSLKLLQEINDAGLLEAYILLARPDAGISRDYDAFRQNNRDKLKRYLMDFLILEKGASNEKKAVS
ncbi:MAG TPA: tetratricopeptide repeat protein [Pyrinomonadaceae bacterium]|jgi:tetratricopeptide (TPR) repeat protein